MTNTTDTRGRYTRQCPKIAEVTTWYNDGDHRSHSTRTCRTWGEARTHMTQRSIWARTTVTPVPVAWVCGVCTTCDDEASEPKVSKAGTATCHSCNFTMPVTRFPTVRVYGYQVRDTRRCRVCAKLGAPMPDIDTHYTVDMADYARTAGPDWRWTDVGKVHIPGISANTPEGARLRAWWAFEVGVGRAHVA